jgi:hypothetical protein
VLLLENARRLMLKNTATKTFPVSYKLPGWTQKLVAFSRK